jgi:DNA-binding GntR family transcriptional regulator
MSTTALPSLGEQQTLAERTADAIREQIQSGAYAAGHVLRQEDLAAQLGVSRIPVREALRQLEVEGYVDLHAHRGATVAGLSADEALEIYEIRASLETLALKLAIPNLSVDDLARAAAALDAIDSEQSDFKQWADLNWQFHETLYAPCRKPRLLSMIKALHDNVGRYLRTSLSVGTHSKPSQQEHRALLSACRKRDTQMAAGLLEKHLASTAHKLAIKLRAKTMPEAAR